MKKTAKASIEVHGTVVNIVTQNEGDYICLTDISRFRNPDATDDLIRNWLRNRNTVEFLGVWEQIHNPDFNPVEFDGIKMQAGLNSFALTPKQWNERTGAIGLISKANPIGVAAYQLQSKLPGELKGKLPTAKQLAEIVRVEMEGGK